MNQYANSLRVGGDGGSRATLYDAAPKAVLAAIAVSLATCGGDHIEVAAQRVAAEWDTLHANGIVPQPLPSAFRSLAVDLCSDACGHCGRCS